MSQQVAKIEDKKQNNELLSSKKRENIILSSILYDKECREYAIQNKVNVSDFTQPLIKKVLGIFNGLVNSNLPPSIEMIVEQSYPNDEDELKRQGLIKSFKHLKTAVEPVNLDMFKEHLFLLKKHKALDAMSKVLQETNKLISKEKNDPSFNRSTESMMFLQNSLDSILESFTPQEVKSLNLSEGLKQQIEKIRKQKDNPNDTETSTSGYPALDDVLSGGYRRKNFSLVCARPAMGKTVVKINQAIEAAKAGAKVVFFSIEMDLSQCLQRALSKISNVKMKDILQPHYLSNGSIRRLKENADEVSKLFGSRLFIEEVNTLTPKQLDSRIKFYQKQFGVDLVFVDYIQIMRTNAGKTPKEQSDFSEISSDLREMCKSLDIALVLGAQLSREVEKRDDKRPMDSDLKNSGSFEQDAAAIIHLYRDSVYNKDTEDKNIIELIVGKNRFGQGNTTLRFSYDYSVQSIYQGAA